MWRRLVGNPSGLAALLVLGFLYGTAILADFLAPYRVSDQNLSNTYHPPTRIFLNRDGWRVQQYHHPEASPGIYLASVGQSVALHWWVEGYPYRLFGLIPMSHHLFGVDPANRVYLLGSDETGRDVFSRLIEGARISLSIGLIGLGISTAIGLIVGGCAGYFGGWLDSVAMRLTELLMAIPGLYLLLALRSAFAENFSSEQMFLLITIILSFLGWSGTARVVRGMVLSLRQQPFVQAAEVAGQTPLKILSRHLLPNMAGYLLVASTLTIPGYILGEAALSFLGIGIQEPSASWGLMLSTAQQMKVFRLNFWWMLLPGLAIFVTVIAFNVLGDVLRDIIDPKAQVIRK